MPIQINTMFLTRPKGIILSTLAQRKRKSKSKLKMGTEDEIKIKFQLKDISKFYRRMMEMPIVLSKFKLPPRTFDMPNEDAEAYFNAINNPTSKKVFLDKINHCTSVVAESIVDSTAKKAWYRELTKERPSLLEQAR